MPRQIALHLILVLVLGLASASVSRAQATCRYDSTMAITRSMDAVISDDDPMAGSLDAGVVLIEFFDPNCIHCRSLEPVMQGVMEEYGDRVRYYKKPFALSEHSFVQIGAMLIAEEAAGKFYEMAGRQLTSPDFPYLSNEQLVSIADEIGLDTDMFYEKLIEGAYLNRVQFLRNQARQSGVRGTPTLIVNHPKQVIAADSRSYECITAMIDVELGANGDAALDE